MMLPYSEYDQATRIAQVVVIPTHVPHKVNIVLTIYTNDGHQELYTMNGLNGDEWRLEGDLITSPDALNFLGMHSGYKLTQLDIRNDTHDSESNVTILNGGDDGFFKALYDNHTPVVQANKIYSSYIPSERKSYNIFVTQTGLVAEPSS